MKQPQRLHRHHLDYHHQLQQQQQQQQQQQPQESSSSSSAAAAEESSTSSSSWRRQRYSFFLLLRRSSLSITRLLAILVSCSCCMILDKKLVTITTVTATAAKGITTARTLAAFHPRLALSRPRTITSTTSATTTTTTALFNFKTNCKPHRRNSYYYNYCIMSTPGATTTTTTKSSSSSSSSTVRTALAEVSDKGEFKRRDAAWRNWIAKDSAFPPEADRYHLYVAYACPWAHRTLITRAVKGLEHVISVTVVYPIWQKTRPDVVDDDHRGWIFGRPDDTATVLRNTNGVGGPFPAWFPGNEPDPMFHSYSVRDLYDHAGDTDGKYSVPVLWDKKQNTIVSNESAEIIRMLNSEFNDHAKNPDLDLYPPALRESIDAANEWIYPTINNGVYRCGFATTQEAYDKAITELSESLDRVEHILSRQRFIAGHVFTEADVRLFVTLLRFDEVYVVYFKTNTRSIAHQLPNILNYCREIYQMPGVKETVNMEQIKAHYYCSHVELNTYSIVPRGPNFIHLLEQPHNRNSIHDYNKST